MALNILIVEDSAVMRQMLIKVLRMTGVDLGEVHEAANGQEGLDILDKHWVDLALVDINMPVMNGEDMIRKARANPDIPELPIVVISTEGSQTRIGRLESYGVRFVRKPFAPETIRKVIGEITGVGHEQSV
jgi:two-component system chemotaxis response regulator CheY